MDDYKKYQAWYIDNLLPRFPYFHDFNYHDIRAAWFGDNSSSNLFRNYYSFQHNLDKPRLNFSFPVYQFQYQLFQKNEILFEFLKNTDYIIVQWYHYLNEVNVSDVDLHRAHFKTREELLEFVLRLG